jgi:hypothetical protein
MIFKIAFSIQTNQSFILYFHKKCFSCKDNFFYEWEYTT